MDPSADGLVLRNDLVVFCYFRSGPARLRYLSQSDKVRRFRSNSPASSFTCLSSARARVSTDASGTLYTGPNRADLVSEAFGHTVDGGQPDSPPDRHRRWHVSFFRLVCTTGHDLFLDNGIA